jgi:DNA replication and repair protein RecF
VILDRLRLSGFRNLQDGVLAFPEEGVAVVGPNAQGKTNLLEAIYYLEIFRSFRGTREDRLIRFGADHFRVEGTVRAGSKASGTGTGGEEGDMGAPGAGGDSGPAPRPPVGPEPVPSFPEGLTVAAAFLRSGRVKKVTVDGEEPPRLADGIGRVGVVLFTPEDVRLVSDGPQERRRFLDILLSINVRGYLDALQRYRQVLTQRNAALREGPGGGPVHVWDPLLVEAGARVTWLRARWIREGSPSFRAFYAEVSGDEEASLAFRPSVPFEDEAEEGDVALAFREALDEGAEGERRRGTTLTGPHRDELQMVVHPGGSRQRDLREFGSGGQRRTAALALRLLEAETIAVRRGHPPLLLLDDIFAELDEGRSERIMGLLERTAVGQVILTAPKDADVRFRSDRLPRWAIRDGRVE